MRLRTRSGRPAVTCRTGHTIGVDIGATAVRAAMMTVDGEGRPAASLERVRGAILPEGTVVDGVVRDPEPLTEALRSLWRTGGFCCGDVVLGVANPQVLVRHMKMPKLTPQQRAMALPFQARDVVALPMDQVVLDFAPVGPAEDGTDQVSGLLVASPREPVRTAVSAVERAGLRVARVDLSSFAVLRSTAEETLEAEAVVDLGAHLTTIVVHHHGVPKLVRTLARGGEQLTRRIAERLGVSQEVAEVAKRAVGLDGPDPTVSEVLEEAVRPLLAEIRSSVSYFRSTSAGVDLQRIALTGRAAALPGLPSALARTVGTPTVHVGAAEQVRAGTADPEDTAWATALALGLAMGAAA